jgi:hypothetical protein
MNAGNLAAMKKREKDAKKGSDLERRALRRA